MEVTERKIQANRRNALKSTGPKSPDGKSRSRWNAVKNGLLAKAVIIERGESKERREDFETLLRALEADLAPEGVLEQILVEKIAVDYWRLRRFLMSETGRIRSQVDALEGDERRRRREDRVFSPSWDTEDESDRESLTEAIKHSHRALEVVRQGLAGEMDAQDALAEAVDALGRVDSDLDDEDEDDAKNLFKEQAEDSRPADNGRTLEGLRDEIERRLKHLQSQLAAAKERYRLRLDARRLKLQAPPVEGLELSMRYETMLERQLQRDLELLANVQRMRVLGPLGYRPVRALAAEETRGPSENGADAAT